MIRTIKILIYFTAVVLLAWLLPWAGHFAFSSSQRAPFTLYSCIVDRFAYVDMNDDGLIYKDLDGGSYSESEFDSILPLFYYRQLTTDGRFPDTICGVRITPQQVGYENLVYRHAPSEGNVRKAKLYPLLETMSGRVDLQSPEDVFRLRHSIEFVDPKTNTVKEEKSERFNKVILDKGFVFPMTNISGNPSTQKEYDEGYLLVDANGKVFHMKQMKDRPYFRAIDTPEGVEIRYAFITEFSSRKTYGLLIDTHNRLYVVKAPSYDVVEIPVDGFDPAKQSIMVIGDMFHWTIRIGGDGPEKIYAVKASDFSLAARYVYPEQINKLEETAKWIFPFTLSFTSYDDQYVYPRLGSFSVWALMLNVILAAIYVLIRRKHIKCGIVPALLIIPLGIFLFIPLLVTGSR